MQKTKCYWPTGASIGSENPLDYFFAEETNRKSARS